MSDDTKRPEAREVNTTGGYLWTTDDDARTVEKIRAVREWMHYKTRGGVLRNLTDNPNGVMLAATLLARVDDLLAVIDRQEERIRELLDACRQRDTAWDNGVTAARNWRKAGRTILRLRQERDEAMATGWHEAWDFWTEAFEKNWCIDWSDTGHRARYPRKEG